MTLPRAVLDADIIFSRVLHELMGRLATTARLFDLMWSEELLSEAETALVKRKGLSPEVAAVWVGHMRREFPEGSIDPAQAPDDIDLSTLTRDPADLHVCALAIAADADYLFTFDRGYLSAPLSRCDIEVPDLDDFLVKGSYEQPEMFRRVIEAQAAAWSGGRPTGELLAAFGRAGSKVCGGNG